ncbi:signal transduction protein [Candidatus Magnetobacterium bavaricum]|uniref:Signal transduction protein n=1 Tax=Candidatus Magnetobacterium bavaricum TaxID=29290 RepID=A0A0F3GMP0_9BACT|nr:signal transduction protein [Candidatus Magnetobacterium bavaricum]
MRTKEETLVELRRNIQEGNELPVMSHTINLVSKQASRESDATITELTDTILQDFALTNKILRMVNTVYYINTQHSGKITTISRAVYILGLDHIRNAALSLMLFENLKDKNLARELRGALINNFIGAVVSRKLASTLDSKKVEEAFLCGIFFDLGKIVVTYYLPVESKKIRELMAKTGDDEKRASYAVLGISYENLGVELARQWHLPAQIIHSMNRAPQTSISKPTDAEDVLRTFVSFSNDLCLLITKSASSAEGWDKALGALMHRYRNCFTLATADITSIVTASLKEIHEYAAAYSIDLSDVAFMRMARQLLTFTKAEKIEKADKSEEEQPPMPTEKYKDIGGIHLLECSVNMGGGTTKESSESLLLRGIQEVANTLIEEFTLNDMLRMILEIMFRGLGFKRIIICIKSPRDNIMEARFGFGDNVFVIMKSFRFTMDSTSDDVFNTAINKDMDLLVNDINDRRIKMRLPQWFVRLVDVETFILMPIIISKMPIGIIYMDKDNPGDLNISPTTLRYLKTLRDQAILAIKYKRK